MSKNLTFAEMSALDQINKNINFFVSNNLQNLSKNYNVGEATLVRLVKKRGFSSLKEMQISYAKKIDIENLFGNSDNNQNTKIINDVANFEVFSIIQTSECINIKDINKTAELLINSNKRLFFGIENSQLSATFLANNLQKIGLNCSVYQSVHGAITELNFLNKEDSIILIFSSSGETKECIEVAKIAHEMNLRYIWIGSEFASKKSEYLQMANIKIFHSYHKNEILRFPNISSSSGQLFISNLLFNIVINNKDGTSDILTKSNTMVKGWNS
ncbi:putative transcriptional regulator [Mesoplasma florum L1]|uniref:Transcriptional regulator n=1 Tax=Mesoplasma florum (strain ATCC 33453 / NBRC 100688 / NCTC 11704 / L1) TaxID=265311 RepID=Q6F0H6_MESFL|nr:MurR/RpiR family transcriptional regulator [Mesoplasma florum]AAT75997.1 putative transcriptional regulator [Mesoplasma florum L1]ATI74286.1 MurR/RpiR family transcriptional regulator [Mesoplasma florum]AVN59244.1 MurR/RpiR family transcriptional regulator [Mesoplasma florum]